MKVIALKEGFFAGSRVRVGQVIDVPQGTKGTWFTPASTDESKTPAKPAKPAGKPAANGQAQGDGSDDLV